jgi:hypothetical protein
MVGTEPVPTPYRSRYRVNILLAADHEREAVVQSLVHAVRTTFRRRPDAQAVAVFAFSSPQSVGKVYDTGRALATRDGLGWGGDASFTPFSPHPDQGRILLTLGSALTAVEDLVADRDPALPSSDGIDRQSPPRTEPIPVQRTPGVLQLPSVAARDDTTPHEQENADVPLPRDEDQRDRWSLPVAEEKATVAHPAHHFGVWKGPGGER